MWSHSCSYVALATILSTMVALHQVILRYTRSDMDISFLKLTHLFSCLTRKWGSIAVTVISTSTVWMDHLLGFKCPPLTCSLGFECFHLKCCQTSCIGSFIDFVWHGDEDQDIYHLFRSICKGPLHYVQLLCPSDWIWSSLLFL